MTAGRQSVNAGDVAHGVRFAWYQVVHAHFKNHKCCQKYQPSGYSTNHHIYPQASRCQSVFMRPFSTETSEKPMQPTATWGRSKLPASERLESAAHPEPDHRAGRMSTTTFRAIMVAKSAARNILNCTGCVILSAFRCVSGTSSPSDRCQPTEKPELRSAKPETVIHPMVSPGWLRGQQLCAPVSD